MVIGVDFDGVVHDYRHPLPGKKMGGPIEGSKESLLALMEGGHTVIIFTAWPSSRHRVIKEWMSYYGIPYHNITNVKLPEIELFIDDKAITFTSWNELMRGDLR